MSTFDLPCFPNVCQTLNTLGVTGMSFPVSFTAMGEPGITGTAYLQGINNGNSFMVNLEVEMNQGVAMNGNTVYTTASNTIQAPFIPGTVKIFPYFWTAGSDNDMGNFSIDNLGALTMVYTGGSAGSIIFNNLAGVYTLSSN